MSNPTPIDFIPGHKLSYATTRIEVFCKGNRISLGTGFTLKFGSEYGLITNWHVVSGRNPITGMLLSRQAAIPDEIKFHVTVITEEWLEDGRHSTQMYFKPVQLFLQSGDQDIWIGSERRGYRSAKRCHR